MRKLSSLVILALLATLLTSVLASPALANHSHFRYGNISWQPQSANEVLFNFTAAFRRDGYSGTHADGRPAVGDIITENIGATSFFFGDGTPSTGTLRFHVTSIDPAANWLLGVALQPGTDDIGLRHTYSAPGEYTAFSHTCCRFTHVNNSNTSYRLETTVTAGGTNHSPVATMPPIVSCLKEAVCEFAVPAGDADGDALNWRLATFGEMFGGNPVGATVDASTGLYTWDTTGAALSPTTSTPSGPKIYYSTQVVITDAQGHKIPVDFLIELVDEVGDPPAIGDATPECGTTTPAFIGQEVTFDVTATDPDPEDEVTLNVVGLPSGATMTPALPLTDNPVTSTFTWTPQTGQEGAHVIQFTATDLAGQTALCPVTINVSTEPDPDPDDPDPDPDDPDPDPDPVECELLAPIRTDGSSAFKRGRTITVKLDCADDGSLSPEISLVLTGNNGTTAVNEVVSSSAVDSGTTMRWDPDGEIYIFNLSTKRSQFNGGQDLPAGRYELSIDASSTTIAVVQFDLVR